ncbi:MAG: hypothetical protein IJQ67_04715 [Bacilli bacterium]|nr:hypothetical protein [Bacilli bacterium]
MEEELKENPQVEEEKEQQLPNEADNVSSEEVKEVVDSLDKAHTVKREAELSNTYDAVIEEARINMKKTYSKQRKTSNIVMLVVVALLVGCFVLVLQKNFALTIIGYSCMGALVVFMIVFYFINRNRLPNKIRDYIILVTEALNAHVFNDGNYQEVTSDVDDRLELGELLADGVYEGATNITSRNVVEGMFANRHFKVGDVALRKGAGRQMSNIFIGKYLSFPNNLHFEGRYVILSKRVGAETDIPNAINDLKILNDEDNFVIYGPKEDSKIAKDTNSKLVSLIKDIEVNDTLLNFVLVIWAGHSAAYLSYSDEIIALPFEREFKKEPFEQYTSQQLQLLNALKTLL